MLNKVRTGQGFIAALDQSGGSTPKALKLYGVGEDAWSNDDEMFDLMHAMRTRIMTSPAFTGDRVLGAILFEQTMDRQVEGRGSAEYLWSVKNVVPFLKVDQGLADAVDGAQIMKPIPGLTALCERAVGLGVFGTKMRSVVQLANATGVNAVVDQQFEVAKEIIGAGLVPIIEPEVDIHSPEKQAAEGLLRDRIAMQLDALSEAQSVMLKLSIPTIDDFYAPLIEHPRVLPRRGAVGRVPPRRGERAAVAPARDDCQLQPCAHRGPQRRPERRRVQQHPGVGDRRHLRRIDHLIAAAVCCSRGLTPAAIVHPAAISRRKVSTSARTFVRCIGGNALMMSHR